MDVDLCGITQIIVDIHSRFRFESALFRRRPSGTVGPAELERLMLDAQAEAYGDALDPATRHPHMWAVKSHYYSHDFYNWPYTFGLLFGIGLAARFLDDPERFRAGYDDLLSRVGMAPAAELAASFGIDLAGRDFWDAGLDVVRHRVDEHERLASVTAT
jgi:oligoendopeptidase F